MSSSAQRIDGNVAFNQPVIGKTPVPPSFTALNECTQVRASAAARFAQVSSTSVNVRNRPSAERDQPYRPRSPAAQPIVSAPVASRSISPVGACTVSDFRTWFPRVVWIHAWRPSCQSMDSWMCSFAPKRPAIAPWEVACQSPHERAGAAAAVSEGGRRHGRRDRWRCLGRRTGDADIGSTVRRDQVEGAADRKHADHGGRGDAGGSGHLGQPPRDPQIPFLWCRLDPEERGLDGAVRRMGRAGLEPRPSGAFERAVVGHARRPPGMVCSDSAVRASRSPRVA